jgi:hypothetical protein
MTRYLPFLPIIAVLTALTLTPAAAQEAPCPSYTGRLFTQLTARHAEIADRLGCRTSPELSINLTIQRFEHGWMLRESADPGPGEAAGVPINEVLFEDDQHYVRYDGSPRELADQDRARLGEPMGRAQAAPARAQLFEHGGVVWDPRTGATFALVIIGPADQPSPERVWWLFTDTLASATRTPGAVTTTPVTRTPTRAPATPTPKATAVAALGAGAAIAPGTLSGRVVWCADGVPTAAPDVQVTVTRTLLSTMTDADGRFALNGAPVDQYLIVGARPLEEAKAMFGAVMPGVLASTERATDVGTLYLNMPDANGCQRLPAVYG